MYLKGNSTLHCSFFLVYELIDIKKSQGQPWSDLTREDTEGHKTNSTFMPCSAAEK